MASHEHPNDMDEAAQRALYNATQQIDLIVEDAERQAEAIRREAVRDAEDVRQGAVDAARRLLDRLQALELPLGELVVGLRAEVQEVSRQFGTEAPPATHGTPLPTSTENSPAEESEHAGEEPETVDASTSDAMPLADQLQSVETASTRESGHESAASPERGPQTDELGAAGALQEPRPAKVKGGRRGLRRQGSGQTNKGKFISTAGDCAVCHRTLTAGSLEHVERGGWRISGDVGLCPQCQADGWQLPDGTRLPVRPGRL